MSREDTIKSILFVIIASILIAAFITGVRDNKRNHELDAAFNCMKLSRELHVSQSNCS